MKVEQLRSRIGGNMLESIGAGGGTASIPALPDSGGKYRGTSALRKAISIPLDKLMPDPDQPRQEFDPDGLDQLAASLKTRGQLQPIRVRWDEGAGRWAIIAGERRYRAAILADLPALQAMEAGELTPEERLEEQLIENCLREDLRPIEQARAFKRLLDRKQWTYQHLAECLNISVSLISQALALLTLPDPVQERVEAGQLAPSVAYQIARVDGPTEQVALAARVLDEGLTRAEVAREVKQSSQRPANKPSRSKSKGASKGRKITSRVIRTATGPKVVVEFKRGLDDLLILAALTEAADQIKAAIGEMNSVTLSEEPRA
jgi:ParB family chromosome partitioning protein